MPEQDLKLIAGERWLDRKIVKERDRRLLCSGVLYVVLLRGAVRCAVQGCCMSLVFWQSLDFLSLQKMLERVESAGQEC